MSDLVRKAVALAGAAAAAAVLKAFGPGAPHKSAGFDESKHPRAGDGKFGTGGGDKKPGEKPRQGPGPSGTTGSMHPKLAALGIPVKNHERLTEAQQGELAEYLEAWPVKPRRVTVMSGRTDYFGEHHPLTNHLKISASVFDPAVHRRAVARLEAEWEQYKREQGDTSDTPRFVDPTPRGVLNHEAGHALQRTRGAPVALVKDPGVRRWTHTLSGQARAGGGEDVAEWVAAALAGKPVHPKVAAWLRGAGVEAKELP